MYTNLSIALVKMLAALISGCLGVAGMLFNYRDPTGALTPSGKWVLTGFVVSTLVAALLSGMEAYKAEKERREQAARNEQVLRELNQSI